MYVSKDRHTTFAEIVEGIKRFRDSGGKRALLVSVSVDLSLTGPGSGLRKDGRVEIVDGVEDDRAEETASSVISCAEVPGR